MPEEELYMLFYNEFWCPDNGTIVVVPATNYRNVSTAQRALSDVILRRHENGVITIIKNCDTGTLGECIAIAEQPSVYLMLRYPLAMTQVK